jgi:hypothetical protein
VPFPIRAISFIIMGPPHRLRVIDRQLGGDGAALIVTSAAAAGTAAVEKRAMDGHPSMLVPVGDGLAMAGVMTEEQKFFFDLKVRMCDRRLELELVVH